MDQRPALAHCDKFQKKIQEIGCWLVSRYWTLTYMIIFVKEHQKMTNLNVTLSKKIDEIRQTRSGEKQESTLM